VQSYVETYTRLESTTKLRGRDNVSRGSKRGTRTTAHLVRHIVQTRNSISGRGLQVHGRGERGKAQSDLWYIDVE